MLALTTLALALSVVAIGLEECRPHETPNLTADAGPSRKLGATLNPVPPTVLTPQWYIDPANSTGCASDSNNGTSATCTGQPGIGPLSSWYALDVYRWGCEFGQMQCPRIGATIAGDASVAPNVTVTFLSSQGDTSDPVVANPDLENGKWLAIVGNLTAQTTGVLASVTAKNRATPQLLQAAVTNADGGVGLAAVNQLIVDTTHPSHAFTSSLVSGSTYAITQPLVAIAPGGFTGGATEVDTWANGDAVAVYTPVTVNLARLSPNVTDFNGSLGNGLYVESVTSYDSQGNGLDPLYVGRGVQFVDFVMNRNVYLETTPLDGPNGFGNVPGWGFANSIAIGGVTGGAGSPYSSAFPSWYGGAIPGGFAVGDGVIDYDAIVNSAGQTSAYQTGFVYVASGKTLTFPGSAASTGRGSGQIWGAGTVNAAGDCRVAYPAGASKGAATFASTLTLNVNGQTKTCIEIPSSASAFGTCNTTLTAAQLDTTLGATTGCLAGPGAAFCNAP